MHMEMKTKFFPLLYGHSSCKLSMLLTIWGDVVYTIIGYLRLHIVTLFFRALYPASCIKTKLLSDHVYQYKLQTLFQRKIISKIEHKTWGN